MSESQPWYMAKELSLARKAAAKLRPPTASVGDSFLIVTEGTVTEPVYFEILLSSLQLSTAKIKVISGASSDPERVIESAAEEVKALASRVKKKKIGVTELERFDHVWAVIDTDVATRLGKWNKVVQTARKNNVNLAHSTPCFEFWLLLHLTMTVRADLVDGTAAKNAFRSQFGKEYSTNRRTTLAACKDIVPLWPNAVKHAAAVRKHHDGAMTPVPANPSTEVEQLVLALNDSALQHLRKVSCKGC